MVGLHRLLSPQWLTFACTIAMALGGADGAVLERRQDDKATAVTSTSSTETTTTSAATAATTTKDSATTTSKSSTSTATDPASTAPADDFPVCDDPDVEVFCLPKNGTEMWPGETYYVTWNPKNYAINSTMTVELNYANKSSLGGESAYSSPATDNRMGYVTIKMEEDWMQGRSRNNLTLYLIASDATSDQRAKTAKGATISLVTKPAEHHPPPPPTPAPDKLGLAIGLPVGLGVFFIILIGLCLGMRRSRHIGLGSVMGRKKGYGTGKSRGQRLGGSRRENDAIRLGELEEDPARYTDDPESMQRRDSEQYHDERVQGEVFRPDVGRLKSWK